MANISLSCKGAIPVLVLESPPPSIFPPGILDGIVATKYVSPTGGTGAGTIGDPWSFAWALTHVSTGGEVVFLRGGDYRVTGGSYTPTRAGVLAGGLDDPTGKIIWMAYPGEFPKFINANPAKGVEVFRIDAAYNWFVDLEGFREHEDRYNYPGPGSIFWVRSASVNGVKLLHTISHEGSNGIFTDGSIGDVEFYGHTAFYGGVSKTGFPRGHGCYLHHTRSGTTKLKLRYFVSFHHHGSCLQTYSSSTGDGLQDDFDLQNTVTFCGGTLGLDNIFTNITIGGSDSANIPVRGFLGRNMVSYNPPSSGSCTFRFFNNGQTNGDAVLEDGYFVGGKASGRGRMEFNAFGTTWNSLAVRRNTMICQESTVHHVITDDTTYGAYTWEDQTYYGIAASASHWSAGGTNRTLAGWQAYTGLGNSPGHGDIVFTGLPTVNKVFVWPTDKYFSGRGQVVIFNWENLTRVPVNLNTFIAPGDTFIVRNVQDIFGATIPVYAEPSGGLSITVLPANGIVYFPMDGVTPPKPFGSNKPDIDGIVLSTKPILPNSIYPPGARIYLSDGLSYLNVADVWVHNTDWTPTSLPQRTNPKFDVFLVRRSP